MMMRQVSISILFMMLGCGDATNHVHDRVGCDTLDDDSGFGDEGSDGGSTGYTSAGEPSTGAEPSDGVPSPTAPCPTFTDGVVTFCPSGLDTCRDVRVVNADGANGGPLAVHWHGTFESPDGLLSWDWAAQQIAVMVEAQDGLMVLPYADPGAPTRPGTPFPWWVVCGAVGTQCDRLDDFVLTDEIVACAVDQGLVDPERLTTSGMSAGGIMTSHLIERTSYLAGAVSWSGGLQVVHQPATPDNDTAVMVLHGGDTDLYCGPGEVSEDGCYEFREPSEIFAADVVAAGNFAFLCDHQAGHSAAMGGSGAQFLALAHRSGHPWAGYPFGSGGNWMLDHYCYEPGDPSPWD